MVHFPKCKRPLPPPRPAPPSSAAPPPPSMAPVSAAALRASLALPHTPFPMRANAVAREPAAVGRLTTALYTRQLAERAGAAAWRLHDGPPYANGALHMGHFLNKVLKDVYMRRALLAGHRALSTPGWDCHGLPIELKALAEAEAERTAAAAAAAHAAHAGGQAGARPSPPPPPTPPPPSPSPLAALALRRLAAATAVSAIAGQAADFRRWGVLADWDGVSGWLDGARVALAAPAAGGAAPPLAAGNTAPPPPLPTPAPPPSAPAGTPPPLYVTMSPGYEGAQLRALAAIVGRGLLHRSLKPVHWSPASRTALAEAELEYPEAGHTSVAAFVLFPLASARFAAGAGVVSALQPASLEGRATAAAAGCGGGGGGGGGVGGSRLLLEAVVWTTTPWTLPANVALAVGGGMRYAVVEVGGAIEGGSGGASSPPTPWDGGAASHPRLRRRRLLLVATDRVAELRRVLSLQQLQQQPHGAPSPSDATGADSGDALRVVAEFDGRDLAGALFAHPFAPLDGGSGGADADVRPPPGELRLLPPSPRSPAGSTTGTLHVVPPSPAPVPAGWRVSPVIVGSAVTCDAGTGVVHTAPGHGQEDWDAVAAARGPLAAALRLAPDSLPRGVSLLPVLCPVDGAGVYTPSAGSGLAGLPVLGSGGDAVLALLRAARGGDGDAGAVEPPALLLAERHSHRYPYDWRSKTPTIVRATEQWFVRLGGGDGGGAGGGDAGGVIDAAVAMLGGVAFSPGGGRARLVGTLGTRAEWCVSRQRAWGVPIPALYRVTRRRRYVPLATSPAATNPSAAAAGGGSGGAAAADDEFFTGAEGGGGGSGGAGGWEVLSATPLLTAESVAHIAGVIEREGGDAWWTRPAADFVHPTLRAATDAAVPRTSDPTDDVAAAAAAGYGPVETVLLKGRDTLDVWFDSGVSWAAAGSAGAPAAGATAASGPVGEAGAAAASAAHSGGSAPDTFAGLFPADMVLEGSDQHRGWFQSSLLTAVAAGAPCPPYRSVVTHGFVLDGAGRKMSKSLGNVTLPRDVIEGTAGAGGGGGASGATPGGGGKKKQGGGKGGGVGGGGAGGSSGSSAPLTPGGTGVGADVLRLWAASSDSGRDVLIGGAVVAAATEAARRLRNTARYLLGTLADAGPLLRSNSGGGGGAGGSGDAVRAAWAAPLHPALAPPPQQQPAAATATSPSPPTALPPRLPLLESLLLHRLAVAQRGVEEGYEARAPHRAVAAVSGLASGELSSLYFDAVKDRLYCDAGGAAAAPSAPPLPPPTLLLPRRAASQLVLWEALRLLVRAVAPVMPFAADDAYAASGAFLNPPPPPAQSTAPRAQAAAADPAVFALPPSTVYDACPPLLPDGWADAAVALPAVMLPRRELARGVPLGADGTAPADGPTPSGAPVLSVPAADAWGVLLGVRAEANRALEAAREAGRIGGAADASLRLTLCVAPQPRAGRPWDAAWEAADSVAAAVLARLLREGAAGDVFGASSVSVVLAPVGGVVDAACAAAAAPAPPSVADAGAQPMPVAPAHPAWRFAHTATLASGEALTVEALPAVGGRCVRCRRHAAEVEAGEEAVAVGAAVVPAAEAAAGAAAEAAASAQVIGKSGRKRAAAAAEAAAGGVGGSSDAVGGAGAVVVMVPPERVCGRCRGALLASGAACAA